MNIIENYQQAITAAQKEAEKYKDLINTYSFMRLFVFALMVIAIWVGKANDNFTVIVIAFILLLLAFMWLMQRQSGFEKQKKYFENLALVTGNEVNSILNHENLYDNGSRFADDRHYYSSDLDIFGKASLFQMINRAATAPGNNMLALLLSKPSAKEQIILRQQSVAELANMSDWKLDAQARLLFAKSDDISRLQHLSAYLKIAVNMPGEKALGIYAKIAPFLMTALVIGACFNPVVRNIAVAVGFINLGIVSSQAKHIKKTSVVADKIGDTLSAYAIVFEKIEEQQWQSAYTRKLCGVLLDNQTSGKIKELSDLINKLNYHLNVIVGFILNVFFVWDIRQVIAIENWKRNNQASLEAAFEVVAEFEALISLTSLNINYPEWCFPEIADGGDYTLTAREIGHPLLQAANRVVNDFDLENARHIDIITGSNMAGKSTFLRTVGINTVLALTGAPVCAKEMKVSVVTVISYMRIKDSLNESTSTFKAELDRLQMLLAAVETEPKVFFLIDEMLRGTNSVDKYLGSKAVIEKLIAKKGAGMVATHDLQIAELEKKYPAYIRNFYFDIQVLNGEMLFDYKIKDGECKTFNASMLLKRIGIDVEGE